jgi:hypothetical protein
MGMGERGFVPPENRLDEEGANCEANPTFAVADIFQFFVMIFVLKSCVFIIGI